MINIFDKYSPYTMFLSICVIALWLATFCIGDLTLTYRNGYGDTEEYVYRGWLGALIRTIDRFRRGGDDGQTV